MDLASLVRSRNGEIWLVRLPDERLGKCFGVNSGRGPDHYEVKDIKLNSIYNHDQKSGGHMSEKFDIEGIEYSIHLSRRYGLVSIFEDQMFGYLELPSIDASG